MLHIVNMLYNNQNLYINNGEKQSLSDNYTCVLFVVVELIILLVEIFWDYFTPFNQIFFLFFFGRTLLMLATLRRLRRVTIK